MKNKLERHSLSLKFPSHEREDLDRLKTSIEESGFDPNFPIVLYEGRILDGFNRYKVAQDLGVEPVYAKFSGEPDAAEAFVNRVNLARRHLTKAQIAALEVAQYKRDNPESVVPVTEISKKAGVTKTTVARMSRKTAEELDDVVTGKTPAKHITQVADSPPPFVGRLPLPAPDPALSKRVHDIITTTPGMTEAKVIKQAISAWCEKMEAKKAAKAA